jgi:integrase
VPLAELCQTCQKKGKRLPRKLGQIIARGGGHFLVRISLGRDRYSGRRRYHSRTLRGGLRAAQSYLNRRLEALDRDRDLEGTEMTCDEYFDRWLEMGARPKLRPKSYRDYQSLLLRYVRPSLGERRLRGIAPLDIQSLYQAMEARGLSPRTIRYTHAVVHSALEQAVRWRLLVTNPSAGVTLPPQRRRREIRVLNPEEARRLLRHALSHRYGLVFAVALTTGMRPSEYLALRWSDIDWVQQTVTVTRTLAKASRGWNFNDTKRARSRRVIKLQSWIIDLLRRSHEEREKSDLPSSAQIFRTAAGDPVNSDYLARCFKRVLLADGFETMRLYDLRHTAATLALSAGVSAKVVSEQLGHASSAFTLDTYSHVLPHLQTEAAGRVEALLFPTCSETQTNPAGRVGSDVNLKRSKPLRSSL